MTEFARACQDTREHTALLRGTAPTRVACLEWQRETTFGYNDSS